MYYTSSMLVKRGGRRKTIDVYCRNGHLLFKNYLKVGKGQGQAGSEVKSGWYKTNEDLKW